MNLRVAVIVGILLVYSLVFITDAYAATVGATAFMLGVLSTLVIAGKEIP